MWAEGTSRLRGSLSALMLAAVVLLLAFACVRVALVRALPAASTILTQIAPHDPDVVMSRALLALVAQRGIISPKTLGDVRRAAQQAPLDARAFAVLGHQQLLDDQPVRAVRTLEAGQRLDARNRLIHLLLLDRYLRTGRFADAAGQFAISSRLVGSAQGPIANAMAEMSLAPETREAVRRTLASDPMLESSVLTALAKSDTAPSTIFALASPIARRKAGDVGNWGSTLVTRLVARKRYADARLVWQAVYNLTPAQVAPPVFDAGFTELPGSAPFNWTLTASGLGAADIQNGTLSVNYYGRDTGMLAGQLLMLAPGAYRFAFAVEGAKTGTGPWLSWSLRCVNGMNDLMTLPAIANGTLRHIVTDFAVPGGCPAQQLTLIGNGGEFPTPITLTLRNLDVQRTGARQ